MNNHIEPPNPNPQSPLSLKEAMTQSWEQILKKAASTSSNGKDTIPIKFVNSVKTNFQKEHLTDFYAKDLQTSRSNLRKVCRITFGIPPSNCIATRLMVEAYHLLENPNETVKKTALNLGFEDPAYFSRFFKKHSGISPEDYRKIFFKDE